MTAALVVPTPPVGGLFDRRFRALTVGMVALISLLAFEALAVATAMPTIADALDGLRLYALAFGGPAAAGVVTMVLAGMWSDARGPAAPVWHGVGWFVVGLVVAGTAPNMVQFVIGRVLQGLGSGLLIVALYVVVARAYPEVLHRRVFAAFAAAWVVPSLVGPAIAGLIVQYAGWRWVFLAVPALAAPAVLLIRPALRRLGNRSAEEGAGRDRPEEGEGRDRPAEEGRDRPVRGLAPGSVARIGWAGGAAVSAGLLHVGGQQRGTTAVVLVALALGGLAVCVPRLLPAGVLRAARGLPTVIALRGLAAAAFLGAEVFIPLLLTRERELAPALAGAALAAGAVSWSVGSWVQGRVRQPKSPATLPRFGLLLMAAGVAAAAPLMLATAVPVVLGILAWAVAGLGIGMAYPSISVLTLELSAPGEQGRSSSALQLSDSLSGATVLAFTGALLAATAAPGPGTYLAGFGVATGLALLGGLIAGRVSLRT
ncbi:MFS transporter [Micromonospora sp. NBC_01699]|uniref:MFS transporter n=1 Tax=Micromonospora sp. NBC_01699 TaxID=2975984 RepID=UPI002E29B37F|nr:MFS transporter [Micromonospora sp. NBC_01699]